MADAAAKFEMPDDLRGKSAEDIAQLYVNTKGEYDKFKSEWEPRGKEFETWSSLGKPEEIKEVLNWAKQVAPLHQKITAGEMQLLNSADYKAYQQWAEQTQNGKRQSTQTNPDDELFAPVEKRLEEKVLNAVNKLIEDRAKGFDTNIQRGFKGLQDQLNLYGHVQRLQKAHPDIDFDTLIKEGAELASAPADKLLEMLLSSRTKEASFDKRVQDAVAAALAEKTVQDDNARVKTLLDSRKIGPAQQQRPTRENTIRNIVDQLSQKHPDIFNQIPLA